jgi:hypothetical protein
MVINYLFIFFLLLGDVMGKATIFLLTTYLFALTMSLYGCVAGILNKGHLLMETAGSGIGFVLGAISLYGICTQAHEVTETVRCPTVVTLFMVHEYVMWVTVVRQWKEVSWLVWG